MKKPRLAFFLISALLLSTPVCAEIYKYTDANGQKRWTDDLSQVPAEQRASVQRMETEEEKPADAIDGKAEKARSASPVETNAAVQDAGAASEPPELSRAALEQEKKELDIMYQQLMDERKQIEKLRAEALDFKSQVKLNDRIAAFNGQTEQYETRLNAFNERINAFNEKIMSKQSPRKN